MPTDIALVFAVVTGIAEVVTAIILIITARIEGSGFFLLGLKTTTRL